MMSEARDAAAPAGAEAQTERPCVFSTVSVDKIGVMISTK